MGEFQSQAPVAVYDGRCGLCSAARRWANRRMDRPVRFLPYQSPALHHIAPEVDYHVAERTVLLRDPDGRVYQGTAAVGRIMVRMRCPWHSLGRVLLIPPVTRLAQKAYVWVAEHRSWLGGMLERLGVDVRPDRKQPGSAPPR